jgi:hypothetical protein
MGDTALDGGAGGTTGDGGQKPDEGPLQPWLGQGSDDQKRNEYLGGFKSIPEANKAHLELYEKSKVTVKIPDSTSSEEELAAFRKANGVPDKPEGYELAIPDLPEGMQVDTETAKWFKEISHKLGLNKHQANTLYAEESKRRVNAYNLAKGNIDKGIEGVKAKWGVDYEANLVIANRAVSKFGGEGFPEFLKVSGLGNNPTMLEFCLKVGKAISEDTTPAGVGPGGSDVKERRYPNSPKMYEK